MRRCTCMPSRVISISKSARAIGWRFRMDWRIAGYCGTLHVDVRTVYRLLHDDLQELRQVLKQHFGIEHLSQI